MANIGAVVGGGLGLLRRRPGAVLCWGTISAVGSAALAFAQLRLTGPVDAVTMTQWTRGGFVPGPLAVQLFFSFLSLILSTVLSAAAFRAVLWPEDRGVASIRLGMDEVRLIGLTLILYLLGLFAGLVGGLGIAFLTALTGWVFGGSPAVAGMAITVLILGVVCLIVFALVRLSVVYPLVLVRGRISLDSGWDLTRGHFWSLLGAYVLIGLTTMAMLFVALLPLMAIGLRAGTYGTTGYWPSLLQQLQSGQSDNHLVLIVAIVAIGSLLSGVLLALWCGGVASAARELLADQQSAEQEAMAAYPAPGL